MLSCLLLTMFQIKVISDLCNMYTDVIWYQVNNRKIFYFRLLLGRKKYIKILPNSLKKTNKIDKKTNLKRLIK